jgi:L-lactate dehydrogenase (cytochrome)
VLLGRAWIYALAARGEAGVDHVLQLMEAEMRVGMTLTGVSRVAEISSSILDKVRRSRGWGLSSDFRLAN